MQHLGNVSYLGLDRNEAYIKAAQKRFSRSEGFLHGDVSTISERDLETTGIRLIDFWERRVRRIVPALSVTVIATLWASWYFVLPEDFIRLKETVNQLKNAGIQVVIVRHVAMQNVNVPHAVTRAIVFGQDVRSIGVPLKPHRQMNLIADEAINHVASQNVTILDLTPCFVDQSGLYRAEMDGVALYADTQHLSPSGARRQKPLLAPTFSGVRKNESADHEANDNEP